MVCLRFEPRAAGWKAQTNPLSFGGTPYLKSLYCFPFKRQKKNKIGARTMEETF